MHKKRMPLFAGLVLLAAVSMVRSEPDPGQDQPPERRQKGTKPKVEEKAPPPVVDLTLQGSLEKIERKLDDGKTIVLYMLALPTGLKVRLPAQDDIEYGPLTGLEVRVTGQGCVIEEGGKKFYVFKKVLKVEKGEETSVPASGSGSSAPEEASGQVPKPESDL